MKNKTVFSAVTNDVSTDYRVHKVSNYLITEGFMVTVFGRKLPNTIPVKRSYSIIRKKMLFNNNFLFYAEYNIRLFFYLLFNKYDIVLSNDLDTLPACFFASKIRNMNLVFDSHELFSEVPELQGRTFVKSFWKTIEKLLLPRIKKSYTVSDSIAKYYHQLYNNNMGVIRNLPLLTDKGQALKVQFPTNNKVILYQGVLNPGRGIKEVIKALHFLDDVDLVIIGYGKVEAELKQLVVDETLIHRVHFLGRVSREKLFNYTKLAAIGMVLEQPLGLSFQYALPNKLFDFIHAEVPIIASNLPEIKKIINQYNVGFFVDDFSPQSLANSIKTLLNDSNLREEIILNQKVAKKELCWENEREKLDLYFKT